MHSIVCGYFIFVLNSNVKHLVLSQGQVPFQSRYRSALHVLDTQQKWQTGKRHSEIQEKLQGEEPSGIPERAQKTGPSWVSSKARLIVQMTPWHGAPVSCLQTLKSESSQGQILTAFLRYTHLIINELQARSWSMPFTTLSLNTYLERPMTIYYTI